MGNPYIDAQRAKYDSLRENIAGFQTRAAEEKRDLTEEELTSIREQSEQAKTIAAEIEQLTEIETRNRKVAELGAKLLTDDNKPGEQGGQGDPQTRGRFTTQDRDPGHYRREQDGGRHSFFADLYRSRAGDADAATRLTEHARAEQTRAGLTTGGNGVGVVPPHWLTNEFETLARQGRALANAVRNIPLGDDPRPLTLPKQTVGTEAAVGEQATENAALADANTWDSDVDVVTPKATAGKQLVSRQMVDMATPAIDLLIYGDLVSVYNMQIEAKVGAAIKAVGTVLAGTGGGATAPQPGATDDTEFSDMSGPDNGSDLALRAAIEVRKARKLPANILAMTVDRYGKFLALKDSTGRPLITDPGTGQSVNVVGVGSVDVDGIIHGLGVIATDGMGDGTLPDTFAALRSSDTLLFESNLLRFRFEEQAGPESIVLGIWGYSGVLVRQGTKAVKRVEITAAA